MFTWPPVTASLRISNNIAVDLTEPNSMARFPETKWKEEKESALLYYKKNEVPKALEELLNKMALVKPDDLYGYMSQYFFHRAKAPLISKLQASEGLAGSGGRSVTVQIQATVCGHDKIVATAAAPIYLEPEIVQSSAVSKSGGPKKSPRSSVRQLDEERAVEEVPQVGAVDTVRQHLSMGLVGMNVTDQMEVDKACEDMLMAAAANGHALHPGSLQAVSSAVAIAGAHLSSLPPFLYFCSQYYKEEMADIIAGSSPRLDSAQILPHESSSTISVGDKSSVPPPPRSIGSIGMPTPVVSVLRVGSGKLKMHEFCLLPLSGVSVNLQVSMLGSIYTELGKVLSSKFGISATCTHPNAPYAPAIDKPDQALQWIDEAATTAGFQCGKDVGVLIDVAAERLYDVEKEKYELIAGPPKSFDDVINIYSDLIQSAKSVVGFIDPLHSKNVQGWKKLVEKLGTKCLLIPSVALENGLPLSKAAGATPSDEVCVNVQDPSGIQVEQPSPEETGVSIRCAAAQWCKTISGTVKRIEQLKAQSHGVLLKAPLSLAEESGVIVDLGVAAQCTFIQLGAPSGLSTILLNRLLQIKEELAHNKIDVAIVKDLLSNILDKQA